MATGFRDRLPARSADERVVAGVAGGVAAAVGLDAVVVRVAVIVLAISGPGLPLYLVAWVLMPDGASRGVVVETGKRAEVRRGVGLGLIVLGAVLAVRALGIAPPDEVIWPVVLVGAGVGVVVWQIGPRLESSRWDAPRIGAGIVVIGAGIAAFLAGNVSFSVVRDSLLATILVVGGLGLILGPWIVVLMRDRQAEQARRVHADARADMAAHLHDSVLQSLALIQRTDDPRAMATLARQQERELRRWLYGDGTDPASATLKAAIGRVAAITEDRHGVAVETVVVGDAPLDMAAEALIAATGEAATNAAKWSGCDRVSVFVEVEDDGIHSYVRDTGVGFEPDEVAEDRLGVRESIHGRMERVGGTAEISTTVGEGTEVHLVVPRD